MVPLFATYSRCVRIPVSKQPRDCAYSCTLILGDAFPPPIDRHSSSVTIVIRLKMTSHIVLGETLNPEVADGLVSGIIPGAPIPLEHHVRQPVPRSRFRNRRVQCLQHGKDGQYIVVRDQPEA